MPTNRLYYDEPARLTFDATVVACESSGDTHRVALDVSAFYPTSGGQLHDLGTLLAGGVRTDVRDVEADDADVV